MHSESSTSRRSNGRLSTARAIDRLVDRMTRWIAIIGLVCLSLVALAVLLDVSLRWLFNSPIHGLEDIAPLVLAIAIASFMPVAMVKRAHARFELLHHSLGRRGQRVLDILGGFGLSIMILLVAWQTWRYAAEVIESSKTTLVLGLSVAPAWVSIAILLTLSAAAQLVVLAQDIFAAARGRES
jgi:TRAP-type C4-dicarboxylate transport system permease small subunit